MATKYPRRYRTDAEQAALRALVAAAAAALRAGLRLPCRGPDRDLWTSDDVDDRAVAVTRCAGCPVIDQCFAAGVSEGAGVWGGRDRYAAVED